MQINKAEYLSSLAGLEGGWGYLDSSNSGWKYTFVSITAYNWREIPNIQYAYVLYMGHVMLVITQDDVCATSLVLSIMLVFIKAVQNLTFVLPFLSTNFWSIILCSVLGNKSSWWAGTWLCHFLSWTIIMTGRTKNIYIALYIRVNTPYRGYGTYNIYCSCDVILVSVKMKSPLISLILKKNLQYSESSL